MLVQNLTFLFLFAIFRGKKHILRSNRLFKPGDFGFDPGKRTSHQNLLTQRIAINEKGKPLLKFKAWQTGY
jgi:hypothetical protein